MNWVGERVSGTVCRFQDDRGFGFVRPDTSIDGLNGRDLFVHVSEVPGRQVLTPGQRVLFSVQQGSRGLQATRIELLPAADRETAGERMSGF